MMSIKTFVEQVTHSRKKSGLIFLDGPQVLEELIGLGIKPVDLASNEEAKIILSDDELCQLLLRNARGSACAFLNIELFVATRFQESKYLDYLVPKLIQIEPLEPIFFVFYSQVLFERFCDYYKNNQATQSHIYSRLN